MKEVEDEFLRDYFRTLKDEDVPTGLNEQILTHIENRVALRLDNQKWLVWSCVVSVILALGGLLGYLYYMGSIEFKSIDLEVLPVSGLGKIWLVIGCCVTLFMVLSLYLSRRLESRKV